MRYNNNMFIDVLEVQRAYHKYRKAYHKYNVQMIQKKGYIVSDIISVLMTRQKNQNSAKCVNRKKSVSLSYTSLMNEAVCVSLSDFLHLLVKVARALIIGEHCLYAFYLKLIKCILLANAFPLPFKHSFLHIFTLSSPLIEIDFKKLDGAFICNCISIGSICAFKCNSLW